MSREFDTNASWASTVMQPIAIRDHYKTFWPDAEVIELDRKLLGGLDLILDIGGSDKMLRWPTGRIAFIAQRFRRAHQAKYDDFTLRTTEWAKVKESIGSNGHISGFYAYGLANEAGTGFERFRIIDFRAFALWACQHPDPYPRKNRDGRTLFHAWPLGGSGKYSIPQSVILYNVSPAVQLGLLV